MRGQTLGLGIVLENVAVKIPLSTAAVQPEAMASDVPPSAPWHYCTHLGHEDCCSTAPWGAARAPDPDALHVHAAETTGTNPGVVVQDPAGREWHVKQPPRNDYGEEGPVEVTLSRVLSAVGYHQPPGGPTCRRSPMRDASGTRQARRTIPPP